MNALSACHEAELRKNVSYLMSEREELIGPLGQNAEFILKVENSAGPEIQSSLSPLTLKRCSQRWTQRRKGDYGSGAGFSPWSDKEKREQDACGA